MSYTDQRSYLGPLQMGGNTVTCTASGQVVTNGNTLVFSNAEATTVCSVGAYVSGTGTNPPAGVTFYVIVGSPAAPISTATAATGTLTNTNWATTFSTFIPSIPVGPASLFQVGMVGTATASGTAIFPAVNVIAGLGPQYV